LKPENIKTIEFNYLAKLSSIISTNISIFNNRMNNLISRVSGVNEQGHYYQYDSNNGKLNTYGIEGVMNIRPLENIMLKISGLYQHTEDLNQKNLTPSFSPNYLGYFQTSYSLRENTVVSLTGRYVGKMRSYWDISQINNNFNQLSAGYIGKEIDGYFVLSSNFRMNQLFEYGFFFNLKVSNLLDTEFRYPTTSEVLWADKGYLGPGRAFLISLGREF